MKKKITLGIAFLCFFMTAKAQVYQKGNVLFDVYYGAPNLYTATFKAAYTDNTYYTGITTSSLGPLGIKAEYLLSEKIGIGVHFNDAVSNLSATYTDPSTSQTYTYTAKSNVMRIFPTLNVHMGNSSNFDPYFSFGLGYNHRSTTFSVNDPNYTGSVTYKSLVPVATRIEFGMRYFFTDNIGINAFVGLPGGALVGAGLSVKL